MENQRFMYAQDIESSIVETVIQYNNIQELKPAFNLLLDVEQKFLTILKDASCNDLHGYTFNIADNIADLTTEKLWAEVLNGFAKEIINMDVRKITALWIAYTLTEKSSQFYSQVSANSAYPSERLFFSSLAEVKNIIKRQLEKMIRISNNRIWSELGFAPFALKKE